VDTQDDYAQAATDAQASDDAIQSFVNGMLSSADCQQTSTEHVKEKSLEPSGNNAVPANVADTLDLHDYLHTCPTNSNPRSAALLAIPGDVEREVHVCCCNCGATISKIVPDVASNASDTIGAVGMCLSMKLFRGPSTSGHVLLAVGYEAGHVIIWDPAAPAAGPLAHGKLHEEPVMSLDISDGGVRGVSGSAEDRIVSFAIDYSAKTVTPVREIGLRERGIGDLSVRQDGKLMASAGWDGRVRLYKWSSGKALALLKYHTSAVTVVEFAPKSFMLASGARDGTVALWDVYSKI